MEKTSYEMRISDWRSDVCSSDLELEQLGEQFSMAFGIHAAQPGIQAHDLHDRKVLIQAEALRHVAGGGMDGIVFCDHVETGHGDMACIGPEQAGHDPHPDRKSVV